MKNGLEKRLAKLRSEYQEGERVLAELESKQANLRDTLLSISGAIQALEEHSKTPQDRDYKPDQNNIREKCST